MGNDLHDGLSLARFQASLRELHARARRGALSTEERAQYDKQRGDIARMLCFAQQLTRTPQQTFRQALRVAAKLPVRLTLDGGGVEHGTTIDLSTGGFAIQVAAARRVGDVYGFALHVGPDERVDGRARVVAARPGEGGLQRASFAFETLPFECVERVEIAVFDVVLGSWSG